MKTESYRALLPALFLLVSACVSNPPSAGQWYKGNTHAHTNLADGDTSPEIVAKYYLENGYNFLILSEHNIFIDPVSVTLPPSRRSDFILIPGQEITGSNFVHTTAMNIRNLLSWELDSKSPTISESIRHYVSLTRSDGGEPILNHPNYNYAVSTQDIVSTRGLHLFELYNGHPVVNNSGDEDHISTEEMWDRLLTLGMNVYCVASDDAHDFQVFSQDNSNPGRGWVMVWSNELTPDAITTAMSRGEFYSSSGVSLKSIEHDTSAYTVVIDEIATMKNLESPNLRGKFVQHANAGYRIEFIGADGVVLATTFGVGAEFAIVDSVSYVRVRVTFTRVGPDNGFEEYYAWGQPVHIASAH